MADHFELEVPARAEHLATVRIFAASIARRFGFGEEAIADLKLALSEAGTLALRTGGDDTLSVRVQAVDGGLDFEVVVDADSAPEDGVGGLDLIKALFEAAHAGPDRASVVIPLRRDPS